MPVRGLRPTLARARRGRAAVMTGFVAVALTGSWGCYPGEIADVERRDLVFTVFDPNGAFDAYTTYAMPDTIIRVDALGTDLPADAVLDPQVLDAVATELSALGYTRLDAASVTGPDVVVILSVTAEELPYWADDSWWSYWRWYPGWAAWYPQWDAGWGPHVPWSDRYPGVRSTGTLTITMLDPGLPAEPQSISVVWVGAIDGLFAGSEASVLSRFQSLVRRAFDQSPYLQAER